MHLLPAVIVALMISSQAFAGQIVFRPVTTGTLQFVAPPPELETPDPTEPDDLGVSYGAITVQAGTSLALNPTWSAGSPQSGYSFKSSGLPAGLVLDPASGTIRGKAYASAAFAVIVADAEERSQSVPVTIVIE